ncbi:hypothetical protein [Ensifer sp. LCM 4579]|uniref:hypothetical protein n=1 Tax=Ensifer sp. LCM 4579 TaxID=1848292 RepID=UPI00155F4EC0|nr:hypothetical protein [Ensifer sp. LCM 4579]
MPIFFFYVMVHAPMVTWSVAMQEHAAFWFGSSPAHQLTASVSVSASDPAAA